jgi:hypothetical protein
MSPEITLIRKTGAKPVMSKRIFLDAQGTLQSDGSQCLMVQGVATRAPAETAHALAELIMACGSDQAIALGALKAGLPASPTITVPSKLKHNPDAITRSREFIDYRPGMQGWALIDFDMKGMPPNVAAAIEAAGGMWNALLSVAPGLQRAARVARASTSSGLFCTETGAKFADAGGAHHYVLVNDGGDIERFLRDLHDRCWLHGMGWHVIGGAGQLLDRSLVDRMVAYGERLCFEGAPIIEPPLAQDQAKRRAEAFDGDAIDAGLTAPRLTEYERSRVKEAKEASAEALGKTANEVRTRHDRALADKVSAKWGMPLTSALRLVTARHRGVLMPYLELEFDHLGTRTVSDVLADPDNFVGETLADPLEGIDYGRCKAKVMRADDGGLLIHSFAHGRGIYLLRHDARSAKAAIENAPANGVVDFAMSILASADLEADELSDVIRAIAKVGKIGVNAVKARMAKEQREREQANKKAAMASMADGRIVRTRPQRDAELTPTVEFLDEILAADQCEEPPMRDASGKLVEVRVREPWALHLLTADGANAAGDDPEAMKAPAEPGLVRLTPTLVELLLERYVRWSVQSATSFYFGALPRPHVDALMEFSPSSIPIVRAINTAPLITLSGSVIDGVGLDRQTGLVHRIDPLLRACLPTGLPTEQEVRDAMNFLIEEWLIDVATDRVGKCIAIMLAMTLIERTLLSERPAFFVTAGQRGGGKTTLVNMIVLAVLARMTAAASWSDSLEERKKALFSYLRQGVAVLAWDNIARGAAISCPHIEAALTAAEVSDRVLGVSSVETAPSTTVHVFTGNSITPRGDMASRSLMLPLNVSRPDPENRDFVHADPLAWTRANRHKIVRALYTILIAGAVRRPECQVAKTRFKTWWSLVGWPMEWAAGLIGVKLDCAELLRAGEAGDEEASAASAALTVLREIWGNQSFTARDVVMAMTAGREGGPVLSKEDEPERVRANALHDALGELVGKRLDRPTAQSIGKLFQKRLVGRPTWIGDGRLIGTLRKFTGHNENTYRVEDAASERAADDSLKNAPPAADAAPKQSPQSPHSLGTGSNVSASGKEGKGGKDPTADPTDGENLADADGAAWGWRRRI